MDFTQSITLALAILGSVLGVINMVRILWLDRVRLRVTISHAIISGAHAVAVDVVNLSVFEVTVKEINIPISKQEKLVMMEVLQQLPKSLPPRRAAIFFLTDETLQQPKRPRRFCVEIRTACGIKRRTAYFQVK